MNAHCYRLENNVAAEFDDRKRIYCRKFSQSAQALEAQREVLTDGAVEETHR